jgi:hypothetical protein
VQAAATGGLGSPNKHFVSVRSRDGADASGSRANKNGRRVARPQSWPGAARHGSQSMRPQFLVPTPASGNPTQPFWPLALPLDRVDAVGGQRPMLWGVRTRGLQATSGYDPNPRPSPWRGISQNVFGADGGTRTRTLREKQIFLPLRLSPPPVGVRGLDCPFAMASRPKAPPVQSLHLPSIEGLARDWPGARAR